MSETPTSALYQGIAGTPGQQDHARTRVHWACGEARGGRVLDIGCGAGIAAILLGREGKAVLGIDRDAEAVAEARQRLSQEEEPVQQRVRFQVGEAHDLGLAGEVFDTVLIGDLLRRLAEPRRVLEQLDGVLRGDGRLVITTGYGEEVELLALGDLLDLLAPSYAIHTLKLIGDAVGLTAIRGAAEPDGDRVLRAALNVAEERLAGAVADAAALRSAALAPAHDAPVAAPFPEGADSRAAEADEALREGRRAAEQALLEERRRLVRLEVQRDGAFTERDVVREALAVARSELEAARADAQAAVAEVDSARSEAADQRAVFEERLRELRRESDVVEEANALLQHRVAELELDRDRDAQLVHEAEARMREQEARAAEGEARLRAAESRLAVEQEASAYLRERRAELARRLAARSSEVEVHRRTAERLATELASEREATEEAAVEGRRLREALVHAQARAIRGEAELAELRDRVDGLEQQATTIADLEAEVKRLAGDLHQRGLDLRTRESELHELKIALRRRSATVSRLEEAVARLEPQAQNLADIRAGRAYGLMRLLWRANAAVRRPFRRSGRHELEAPDDDAQALPAPVAPPPAAPAPAAPPVSTSGTDDAPAMLAPRGPGRLTTRQRYDALDIEADRRRFLAGAVEAAERRAPAAVADLRVAAVVGVHLEAGLETACEVLTPRPDNWRYVLDARPPHLLLVESTFAGNRRSWSHRVAETIHPDAGGLADLVAGCRERGVATAFWFTRPAGEAAPFTRAMRLFEHVFVADPAAIATVEAAIGGGARVSGLPLAAAAAGAMPAGEARDGVVWVGRWPARWPPRARAQLTATLEAALPHGLSILDEGGPAPPAQFARTLPCTGRADRLRALKSARVAVAAAPPGSRALPPVAWDALAAGASVLLLGPQELVPAGLDPVVVAVTDAREAEAGLARLLSDEGERSASAARAQDALAAEHTLRHRLESLAETVGLAISSDG